METPRTHRRRAIARCLFRSRCIACAGLRSAGVGRELFDFARFGLS